MGPPRFELGSPAPQAYEARKEGISRIAEEREFISLKEYFEKYKDEWLRFMEKRGTSKATIRDYISAVEKYLPEDVTTPEELSEVEKFTKPFNRCLGIFFTFLEEEKDVTEINGFSIKKWRKNIPKKEEEAEEIYISDKELKEAYNNIRDTVKPVFKLIEFSGGRLSQVVRALHTFDANKIVVNGKVARYPIGYISKGTKKGYWLYFPSEFVDELIEYAKRPHTYEYLKQEIAYNRVTAKRLRKWHMNFLVQNDVPESIVDFIQGRSSLTIGTTHYLNKTKEADRQYARIVDKFPIPP